MNDEQKRVIRELREAGFAVAIFSPEEIGDDKPHKVEDGMVSGGWRVIEQYSTVA